jgi:2-polyprenyl-6-hydroxyphenyl methylase/3-demethylubiquinone-9 3-methyltransferase
MAGAWWDPEGQFRPLHKQGPARLRFIRDALTGRLERPRDGLKPLSGLNIVDIGCGGGLVSEPLARLGAHVTGIDPTPQAIAVAKRHADAQGLAIDYRVARAEDLTAAGETFDAAVCLEVVEHVPDPAAFIAMIARLVRPGGMLVVSTLNRTWKSYALAIVAAEYVLGWLPRGTHDWNRFITPDELARYLQAAGLGESRFSGLVYDVLRDEWRLDTDLDVNYLAVAARTLGSTS